MAQVIGPHTVALLRLLACPDLQETLLGNRGRRSPTEGVVDFVLAEVEGASCFCGKECIDRYSRFPHFLEHIQHSLGAKAKEVLARDVAEMGDIFSLHRLILDALLPLVERLKDPTLDKANQLDLFLRRTHRDLKTLSFGQLAKLANHFDQFLKGEGSPTDLVPSYIQERAAHDLKPALDQVILCADPFGGRLLPAKFRDPLGLREGRFGGYMEAMEAFQEGDWESGSRGMHDFFDDNIYLYFETSRHPTYQHFEQKKEEYKVAVEHSSLQRVALGLQIFLLEAAGKLLEETLRWAQLNHHETQVQYCLLYKGKAMEKLGEPRLHFTYVEDALVKSLACGNFTLQLHSCLQHIALDVFYDLRRLRKDIGQHRSLSPSVLLNSAFVKVLADPRLRALAPHPDIYALRALLLCQRRDYLLALGLRKKNLYLDKCNPSREKTAPPTLLPDFEHLDKLLDERISLFQEHWAIFLLRRKGQHQEYQLAFFDSYFQVRILLRRDDPETASTYMGIMEKIVMLFPEPQLLFKLWTLKVEILVHRGCFESAFASVQFLMRTLENAGFTKELFLKQKLQAARILSQSGRHIRAFEELNAVISRAKEHSLGEVYIKAKLLQIKLYFDLGFLSKCLSILKSSLF